MNNNGEGEMANSNGNTDPVVIESSANELQVTANPFQQMAMAAINSGNVDQLGQMLELQQKWEADQARKAFVAAMVLFKAEPIHIGKNKLVSFKTSSGKTEYNHAELVDVTNALVPTMARHGLSHDWSLSQEGGGITVTCTITHRDGHSKSVSMTAPADQSGGKNTIQAIASTKTYLERYTLLAATGVATGGEIDDDGRPEVYDETVYISEQQEIILRDLMEAYVTNKRAFGDYISKTVGFTVTSLSTIPAKNFDEIHGVLKGMRDDAAA